MSFNLTISSLLFFFGFFHANQVSALEVPAHTAWVVDQAGILSNVEQQQIHSTLERFHRTHGPQLQLLIIPSLEGETVESYSIRVVDQWKLGDEKRDDGALLLVAMKEREIRIEVGQGLEGDLPDLVAGRIIRDTMVPFFKQGKYKEGIIAGLQEVAERTGGPLENLPRVSKTARVSHRIPLFWIFILFIVFFFLVPRLGNGLAGSLLGGTLGGYHGARRRGSWGGGSGWGGGGFGGGGGGGFSGGGASGRW